MEREFENTGTQPLRFRGEYKAPGEKFTALPEEVEFYLQIGAARPTTNEEIKPSDAKLVAEWKARAAKQKGGFDCVPATPSALPGSSFRRKE